MKKNLFITLMLVLLALPLASCGNDDEPIFTFYDEFRDMSSFNMGFDNPVMGFDNPVEVKVTSVSEDLVYAILTIKDERLGPEMLLIIKNDFWGDNEGLVGSAIKIKILRYKFIDMNDRKYHDPNAIIPTSIRVAILCVVEPVN